MRFRAAPALLLGVLLISGCAVEGDQQVDTAGAQSSSAHTIWDFTGDTLEGSSFDGAQLAGKPAVLWFWAPWCPTCRAQAPAVSRLAERYEGDVNVLSVGGLGELVSCVGSSLEKSSE
jgi:thiol-disulfide isomerase/thioredoxin